MSREGFVRKLLRSARDRTARLFVPAPARRVPDQRVVVTLHLDGAAIARAASKTNHRKGLR